MLLLLFAALVCAVNAAIPCQAPAELTFHAARQEYADNNFRRFFTEYDRNNARVVLFEQSFNGSTRDAHEYLFLHQSGNAYDLDFRSRQCTRFPAGPFRPFEVPPNSTFEDEYQLGGPNEYVVVDRWSDRIPGRQRETWIGEFSLDNCYPVSQFILNQDDFNQTSITNFYDVVQGIVNPSDFDIPPECANSTYLTEMPRDARFARSVYLQKMFP